jgi:hypothetical protein
MNEDKLAQAIGRSQRAKELLENELLIETIEGLKAEFAELIFTTSDTLERERTVYARRAFDLLTSRLASHVANGNLARREMDDIVTGKKRQQFGIV